MLRCQVVNSSTSSANLFPLPIQTTESTQHTAVSPHCSVGISQVFSDFGHLAGRGRPGRPDQPGQSEELKTDDVIRSKISCHNTTPYEHLETMTGDFN